MLFTLLLLSCSATKFVPDGEHLLSRVHIVSQHNKALAVKAQSYIRQHPNSKWFSLARVPLGIYSLSGTDTTKWGNRVLQRIGEEPVIYDSSLAEVTRYNMEQMLRNDGYLHATVDLEPREVGDKQLEAIYYLHERNRYTVSSIRMETEDDRIGAIIKADSAASLLHTGMPFSIDVLEAERRRITKLLKDKGYYRFQKDYITFEADTAHHSTNVGVKMNIALFRDAESRAYIPHRQYRIGDISFVSGAGLRLNSEELAACDTIEWDKYRLLYKNDVPLRLNVIAKNMYIEPGELYSQSVVDRTHNSFAQLSALRYTSLRMEERPGTSLLDCYVMFEKSKRRSVSFELEGTNTAGDLGAAASVTFSD